MSSRPQSKYDPSDFIIPAQDSKGHSERVYASIQPGHSRQLDIILGSRRWPFRTRGDIIRWSIKEGIGKLEMMEDIPSVSAQVDVIAGIMREEQFHAEWEATFEQMHGVITRHMNNGAYGEVRRVIAHVRAAIDRMPDGYWKDRYMGTLEDRFERALETAEAMSDPARQPRAKKGSRRGHDEGHDGGHGKTGMADEGTLPGHRVQASGRGREKASQVTGRARAAVRLIGGRDVGNEDAGEE